MRSYIRAVIELDEFLCQCGRVIGFGFFAKFHKQSGQPLTVIGDRRLYPVMARVLRGRIDEGASAKIWFRNDLAQYLENGEYSISRGLIAASIDSGSDSGSHLVASPTQILLDEFLFGPEVHIHRGFSDTTLSDDPVDAYSMEPLLVKKAICGLDQSVTH